MTAPMTSTPTRDSARHMNDRIIGSRLPAFADRTCPQRGKATRATSGDQVRKSFGTGDRDSVAAPGADDWVCDRVEFRLSPAGDVLLHRAPHDPVGVER